MNLFKTLFGIAILLVMIVTCSNVQTLRDEFASKPNKIEQSLANWIDRMGGGEESDER